MIMAEQYMDGVREELGTHGAPGVEFQGRRDGDQQTAIAVQDTSVVTDVAMLDSLDKASQEVAVTRMLDQSRQWLDRAMEATNPAREVSEFKAFVATVAEASKQKKLSEDIQLDAVEMVRRTERALGVAIRKGQEAGEIRTAREGAGRPRLINSGAESISKPSAYDFATNAELHGDARNGSGNGIYGLTDDVTDAEFEAALDEARAEGNMSRANVVRKVKTKTAVELNSEKWDEIARMADDGMHSSQIAREVGMSEGGLRSGAKQRGITFRADAVLGKGKRIRSTDVMENIVVGLEATASSLEVINFDSLNPDDAVEWLARVEEPMRAVRRMVTQLKEISNGNAA